jgi:hypothetical protein
MVSSILTKSPDRVLSVCALLVAILSAVFAGWQSRLAYNHNRVSVSPKLDYRIEANTTSDGLLKIELINVGLGPAIVKNILVTFDKVAIGRSGWETCSKIDQIYGLNNIEAFEKYCWILSEEEEIYLREDEEITIYQHKPKNQNDDYVLGDDFKRLGLSVRYCSLYNDCWTLDP